MFRLPEQIETLDDEKNASILALSIRIDGVVQGVGFRPFLYGVAQQSGVFGQVRNDSEGVLLEIEGRPAALKHFAMLFNQHLPPLAVVEHVQITPVKPRSFADFKISATHRDGALRALPSPDAAVCAQCLAEMQHPHDRRYRYPFINCTHCGPRYSIILAMPYDRPNTTMAQFPMCRACRAEYEDPGNRRFHAQPIACPACGPQLTFWKGAGQPSATRDAALAAAIDALQAGRILALKGLGGFHLMADACNPDAVASLRARKQRARKPFAVMYPDMQAVQQDCKLDLVEQHWLASPVAPILLLRREADNTLLAPEVAPGCHRIGAMLPYTPLHHLLCQALQRPLVATSGNLSEEPICYDEQDAWHRLRRIADVFLVHDRPIVRPLDDSIMQVVGGKPQVLRAARGIAPYTLSFESSSQESILAAGAHQKSTIALGGRGHLICSQHIGDLDTAPSRRAFASVIEDMQAFYQQTPAHWCGDKHPDYASSQWLASQAPDNVSYVQHHYAHVLSCMAEHHLEGPVLGIAWDGTGLGDDGAVWGGEALQCDWSAYTRKAHLRPFLLPGGERAAREPWRSALGLIAGACGVATALAWWREHTSRRRGTPSEAIILERMLKTEAQCVWTSSMGRLFDGVAAILGLSWTMDFEGEAAMRLEAVAQASLEGADVDIQMPLIHVPGGAWQWDWRPMVRHLLGRKPGHAVSTLAHAFHRALAEAVHDLAATLGETNIVLTGGCFQNALLSQRCETVLTRDSRRTVYTHQWIPPNDGGIAVGQAAYALRQMGNASATEQQKEIHYVSGDTRQGSLDR